MSGPPFTMSKYASELELLRDKTAWQERRIRELASALRAVTGNLCNCDRECGDVPSAGLICRLTGACPAEVNVPNERQD